MVRLTKKEKEILLSRFHVFSQSERIVLGKLGFHDPLKLIQYLQKYRKDPDTTLVY